MYIYVEVNIFTNASPNAKEHIWLARERSDSKDFTKRLCYKIYYLTVMGHEGISASSCSMSHI